MKKYNGWANYETWAVNLWLTNDEDTAGMLSELAQGTGDLWQKAEELQGWVQDDNPVDYKAGLYSDLLNASLGRVDWREIILNHDDGEGE
jgi:hypothetical protein